MIPGIAILVMKIWFSANGHAQQKKADTVVIKSSTVCGMCKERIESAMAFEKGVKSSEVDLDHGTVTIVYNPAKTSADKLRVILSKIGYDADSIPADEKAYAKLPACCKKGVPKH